MNDDSRPLPAKPGDWVETREGQVKVAKVRDVYFDPSGTDTVLVDLVMFDYSGKKIGRVSPAMGGPRSIEPACDYSDWKRIEEPDFPVSLCWVPNGDGKVVMQYATRAQELPDRAWVRVKRPTKPVSGPARTSDYDPALEAHARRMSAQELRDTAKSIRASSPDAASALVERADVLEREAEKLMPAMAEVMGPRR